MVRLYLDHPYFDIIRPSNQFLPHSKIFIITQFPLQIILKKGCNNIMENVKKIKEIIKELKCINNDKPMSNLCSAIYQLENAVDLMQGKSKSSYIDTLMEYTFLG